MNKRMKNIVFSTLALGAAATFLSCQGNSEEVVICSESTPQARIVIAAHPSEVEQHSSVVLQDYLHRITGAQFEIVTDDLPPRDNDITIGKVNRPEISDINFQELEEDGEVALDEETLAEFEEEIADFDIPEVVHNDFQPSITSAIDLNDFDLKSKVVFTLYFYI